MPSGGLGILQAQLLWIGFHEFLLTHYLYYPHSNNWGIQIKG
jgi:hypothetical protein